MAALVETGLQTVCAFITDSLPTRTDDDAQPNLAMSPGYKGYCSPCSPVAMECLAQPTWGQRLARMHEVLTWFDLQTAKR
jgi:hypothetical protein